MRRPAWLLALSVAMIAGTAAQERPDFSGTWALDLEKTAKDGTPVSGSRVITVVLKLADSTLTREFVGGRPEIVRLDGAPVEVRQGEAKGTATGRWDGPRIVVDTAVDRGTGVPTRTRTTYMMEGTWLVILTAPIDASGVAQAVRSRTYYTRRPAQSLRMASSGVS